MWVLANVGSPHVEARCGFHVMTVSEHRRCSQCLSSREYSSLFCMGKMCTCQAQKAARAVADLMLYARDLYLYHGCADQLVAEHTCALLSDQHPVLAPAGERQLEKIGHFACHGVRA